MIPAGYLLKRIVPPPGYLPAERVADVCSLSDCVNDNVVDVQSAWRHNGFGLANDAPTLASMAAAEGVDASDATLFYYEAFEEEIESDGWTVEPGAWRPLTPLPSASVETDVAVPSPASDVELIGYDVVVFNDFLEHSPLSCNHVAAEVAVNKHCLFDTLDDAKAAIDSGAFGGGCEDGIYRIFSVSVVSRTA